MSEIIFKEVIEFYSGDVGYLRWLYLDNPFILSIPEYKEVKILFEEASNNLVARTIALNQQSSLEFLFEFYNIKANKKMLIQAISNDSTAVREWLAPQVSLMDATQDDLNEVVECETCTPEQLKWFLEKLKSHGNELTINPKNFEEVKINPSVFIYLINEFKLTFPARTVKLYASYSINLMRFSIFNNLENYQENNEVTNHILNPRYR